MKQWQNRTQNWSAAKYGARFVVDQKVLRLPGLYSMAGQNAAATP